MTLKAWAALAVAMMTFGQNNYQSRRPWQNVFKIPGRFAGQVTRKRIKIGMTEDEVIAILGKPQNPFDGRDGVERFSWRAYPRLGLDICFSNLDPCTKRPTDTMRVNLVWFEDLIDGIFD